jgi:hypothetical protein
MAVHFMANVPNWGFRASNRLDYSGLRFCPDAAITGLFPWLLVDIIPAPAV